MSEKTIQEAEKLALRVILWPFLIFFPVCYLIFHSIDISVRSMAFYVGAIFVVVSLVFYVFGYLKSNREELQPAEASKRKWKPYFEAFSLSIIYAGMITILTAVLAYLVVQAYPGAHVIRIAAAFTGGAIASLAAYSAIRSAYESEIMSITRNLSVFMFGGLLLSAVAVTDPNWYLISFSYLGMTPSLAAKIFNFTLIFTGLGTLVLSKYFFELLDGRVPDQVEYMRHRRFLRFVFWTMGIGIMMVGLIPYAPGIQGQIHTAGAMMAGIFFFFMAAGAKKLIPGLHQYFYILSASTAGIIAGFFFVFALGNNSLATVEVVTFIAVFVWIFLTIKSLDFLRIEA